MTRHVVRAADVSQHHTLEGGRVAGGMVVYSLPGAEGKVAYSSDSMPLVRRSITP